jgi:hypothetical protein
MEATTAQMRPRTAQVIPFRQKSKRESQVEFKNRLRAMIGLQPQTGNVLRVGTWMAFRCGDKVRSKSDARHVGTVEAIINGSIVKIRWSNGWLSYIPLADVERAVE